MKPWQGLNATSISDPDAREACRRINLYLKDLSRTVGILQTSGGGGGAGSLSASYLTVANEDSLSAERALAVQAPITKSDGGPNSALTIGIGVATPSGGYGTTALAGSAASVIRSDARFPFPSAVMSVASLSTLTLTDDATNQALTGSLGGVALLAANNQITLDKWTSGGGLAPTVGVVLSFTGGDSTLGTSLFTGLVSDLSWLANATYSGTIHRGARIKVTEGSGGSTTFTNATLIGAEVEMAATSSISTTSSWTERTGIRLFASSNKGSAVTVTDFYGLRMTDGTSTLGTAGTYTNARSAIFDMPRTGGAIRRGIELNTPSTNVGTEAGSTEGYYCGGLQRGTTNRRNFAAEGATTGAPMTAVVLEQITGHAVGTARRFIKGIDPSEVLGGYMGSYSPGSFSVPTEEYMVMSRHLKLTGVQRVGLTGTATLRLT